MSNNILPSLDRILNPEVRTRDGHAEATLSADGNAIALHLRDDTGQRRLVIELSPRDGFVSLSVPTGDLRLCAEEGNVDIRAARDLSVRATTAEWNVGSWRVNASEIRERAESVLFEATKSMHCRAGRLRTVVKGVMQMVTERTSLRSKEDTTIDGKRILLG